VFSAVALLTAAMLPFRESLEKAHVALLYLVVVLVASARVGRSIGLASAVLTFLCFNYFFLQPYYTFIISNPLDWLVLFTYLVTAFVATQLFYRARVQTDAARRRASEIERLSTLGAETLNVGRAEDALGAVASVIRTTLHVAQAEVYLKDPREDEPRLVVRSPRDRSETSGEPVPSLVTWVAREGLAAAELVDGTTRLQEAAPPGANGRPIDTSNARILLMPLRMRERTVGVLRLVMFDVITLDPEQQQFVDLLSYYAALGVERVRLTMQAEQAAALAEADRLKDALLAAVSHDLRTPLTTIRATAHEIAESGDARGHAIEAEANRLNELVADLLDLSKLQAGAVKITPEVNEAEDLIGAALRQLAGPLGQRKVNVTIEPPGAVLLGRFDFVHSLRVLVNLLENAHKYSPPDKPIDIGARRDGDVLVFSVGDRGPGIPNAERHLISSALLQVERGGAESLGHRPGAQHREPAGRAAGRCDPSHRARRRWNGIRLSSASRGCASGIRTNRRCKRLAITTRHIRNPA
jgi:two-component system sensor histidine kinase KdpD